jgi:hypothetical protein
MIKWFEELPDKCPPNDAFDPEGFTFYRLTVGENPAEQDFNSQRATCPNCNFKSVSECVARSLSVWDDIEKCLNLLKLPRHKNKKIMTLALKSTDGLALQTFKQNHYSWWRSSSFNLDSVTVSK